MSDIPGSVNPPDPRENTLLAAVPQSAALRLFPHLELVSLQPGQILHETGDTLSYAYFPTTAVVSLMYAADGGTYAELLGREGILGMGLYLGGDTAQTRAVVETAGQAYRVKGELLKKEFNPGGALREPLLHYTLARIIFMMQSIVCNRHHSTEQQLCRWLLIGLDILPPDDLKLSEKLIRALVGAPSDAIGKAARKLQNAGLIQQARGWISALDRPKLEARACECYRAVRTEHRRPWVEAAAV